MIEVYYIDIETWEVGNNRYIAHTCHQDRTFSVLFCK